MTCDSGLLNEEQHIILQSMLKHSLAAQLETLTCRVLAFRFAGSETRYITYNLNAQVQETKGTARMLKHRIHAVHQEVGGLWVPAEEGGNQRRAEHGQQLRQIRPGGGREQQQRLCKRCQVDGPTGIGMRLQACMRAHALAQGAFTVLARMLLCFNRKVSGLSVRV